jgi:hypothetical protein
MRHHLRLTALLVALLLLLAADSASAAIVLDGTRDPDYGAPLSTQTTQTSFDDNTSSLIYFANGSELDEAYGVISDGVLYLFFTGSLASRLVPSDNPDYSDTFLLFIDSVPGGQNVARDPYGFITGLKFDPGFEADQTFRANNEHYTWAPVDPLGIWTEINPTSGTGTWSFLGVTSPGGPGVLNSGTNPFGIRATINCSNLGGVTAGCAASSGAGVTTGIEWAIPLAAIGAPPDCIRVSALIASKYFYGTSNQSLGPMPPGTCSMGPPGTVDFASMPGDQFFTVCPAPTPAQHGTWGQLKLRYH